MSVPGKRVLITEDEFFLALCLGQVLEEQGYAVIGPAGDVEEALELVKKGQLSGAILDINLNGEMVFPVAKELMERNIPFLFTTGYRGLDIPPAFRDIPRLEKPVPAQVLVGAVKNMLSRADPRPLH